MSMFGRNEPCPCGSGKKYKKCCLPKEEAKWLALSQNPSLAEVQVQNEYFQPATTSHNALQGMREFALAVMDQMGTYLRREHKRDDMIRFLATDLLKLVDVGERHYFEAVREILEMKGLPPAARNQVKAVPALTRAERILVRNAAQSILAEYAFMGEHDTADYGAMKVIMECCYQAVARGIEEQADLWSVKLFVDTGNQLVDWELQFSDDMAFGLDQEESEVMIYFDWHSLDEIENEYESYAHTLTGLREESLKTLATALVQESSTPRKSADKISYTGLAMNYFGLLEQELRDVISFHEGATAPKKRMWRELCEYLQNEHVPIVSDGIELLGDKLKALHGLRNRAAHGEFITHEEFAAVRALALDSNLLAYISQAKSAYAEQRAQG